jgi:chromosome segregation ATPase
MIEEMLEAHKDKLIAAVGIAQKDLSDLEGSKSALQKNLEDAKTRLEEKKADFVAAQSAREEATAAMKAAQKVLAESKDLLKKGEAGHAKLEKELANITAAYQEHFKAPMDAGETPTYNNLKPFIANLGLEDSLSSALPSSCAKAKEQRGSFDELVLGELGKALVAKIEFLTKTLAEEAAAVSERKLAVTSAEADLETKTTAEKEATANFEAAKTTQHDAEASVKTATDEWATFEPRVTEATDKYNLENTKRIDFEEGTLKDFANLRDKEAPAPVEEEAAPAGA